MGSRIHREVYVRFRGGLWKPVLETRQGAVVLAYNLHRENLKPSEKTFAYKMKLDAMKHQGKRLPEVSSLYDGAEVLADNEANHATSAQVGPKCDTDGNGRAH